jgi:hypothetical protein
MSDTADGWIQDVRLPEKEMCALLSGFILLPMIIVYLIFFLNPPVKYRKADDASDEWIPGISMYYIFVEKIRIA